MEAWEIKTDDSRSEDSIFYFVLFCEDEVAEPLYFEKLAEQYSNVIVNTHKGVSHKKQNVNKALSYCKKEGLLDSFTLDTLSQESNIWCIYDRDKWEDSDKNSSGDIDFDTSIRLASDCGVNVAWSNDSFELWILLHFTKLSKLDVNYVHRSKYYDDLTAIIKGFTHEPEILSQITSHPNFNYKDGMKKKKHFKQVLLPELIKRIDFAKANANLLESLSSNTLDPSERPPCTLVHKLVEEIDKVGIKK
jgi:hypothetical protein